MLPKCSFVFVLLNGFNKSKLANQTLRNSSDFNNNSIQFISATFL